MKFSDYTSQLAEIFQVQASALRHLELHVIALDVNLLDSFDGSLENKTVSVVGTMGIPKDVPGRTKLIVEKLASHETINQRAYSIYESGQRGSAADPWLRAERELLNM